MDKGKSKKKPAKKAGKTKKKKPRRKLGNPKFKTKYRASIVPNVEKLATIGCSNNDIAWMLKIHPATFRRWLLKHTALCECVKKGIAERNTRLRKSMFDSAIKRQNIIMQIFLAKNWLGMADRQDINFPDLPDADESIIKFEIIHTNSKRTPASGEDPQAPARSSKPPKPPGGKPKLTVPAKEVEKKLPARKKRPQKRVNLM